MSVNYQCEQEKNYAPQRATLLTRYQTIVEEKNQSILKLTLENDELKAMINSVNY